MYCPVCGKQQVSNQTRFCSGCGFPLTGVAEVIAAGGASPNFAAHVELKVDSPRKRGIKQGAMVMLVGCLLVVPILAITMAALNFSPFVVPIVAVISFMGGLLRILYALMFEAGTAAPGVAIGEFSGPGQMNAGTSRGALPPQTSIPVSDFRMPAPGNWRDSADLAPNSVTESTTRLLEKDETSQ